MGSSKEQILKTLLYGDIFDYPLHKEEVWRFLISSEKPDKKEISRELKAKNNFFESWRNLFFIKNRKDIVGTRINRKDYSLPKIIFAKKIIKKLSIIPTVRFIGISGALAMLNSEKDDDIDLFVIAAGNFVWTTRLLMVISLIFLGIYRRKQDKHVSDKICLNMLIDENALFFPKQRHDLYTAHEISQIMPVFNRDRTYEKFLHANVWVKEFLPNVFVKKNKPSFVLKTSLIDKSINYLFKVFAIEFFARNIQLWHMKRNITKETIGDNFLAFHPFDYKSQVLNSYKKKITKYEYSN